MLGSDSPAPIKKRIEHAGLFALSSYFFILLNQGLSAINSDLTNIQSYPLNEEVAVGKFGTKTLYRKTITGQFNLTAGSSIVIDSNLTTNVTDTVLSISGVLKSGSNWIILPHIPADFSDLVSISVSSSGVRIYSKTTTGTFPMVVVIEYSKL